MVWRREKEEQCSLCLEALEDLWLLAVPLTSLRGEMSRTKKRRTRKYKGTKQ